MLTPEQRAEHERKTGQPSLLDWLLIAASIVSVGYIFVYYDYIIDRIIYVDAMAWSDIVLSITLILLVLEGTRRVLGPALSLTCIAFMLYAVLLHARSSRSASSTSSISRPRASSASRWRSPRPT